MMYGAPTHRLEYHMDQISTLLDVKADFTALPRMILCYFGEEGDISSTSHVLRTGQGYHMAKLSQVKRGLMLLLELFE